MKTIDLRPWAVAVIASVYSVVFWMFQAREPTTVRPDEPEIGSSPVPEQVPEPMPVQAPRIRTRSS